MASEKVTQLIEDVKGLTVLELSELVKALEEEFGVSAAAPMAMMAAPAAGGAAAAEEKSSFTVELTSAGDSKINVIKAVRELTGLGLKEAKDRVDDYLNSQPARQSSVASAQSEAKRRSLLWLALIVAISLLAYYFLSSP